ncbi:MAG TPA: hypothetical protein ENI20_01060 [Bacteroides sp.]|nr:hypothetical protein [Bacteroides sp.]
MVRFINHIQTAYSRRTRNYCNKILFVLSVLYVSNPVHAQSLEEIAREKIIILDDMVLIAEQKGISTEKERMTIHTAKIFLDYANWDEANTALNQQYFEMVPIYESNALTMANALPDFERSEVVRILDNAIADLRLIIDSEYTRKSVPKVDFTKARVSDNKITQDGRPIFLIDHTWKPVTEELLEFYGAYEGEYITPDYVLNDAGDLKSSVTSGLEKKPDGRIGSIFIDHNNLPGWSEIKYDGFRVGSRMFGRYDIDHPGARELYGFLLKGTVPRMAGKNYTKLGYELFNEPSFFTQKGVWNTGEVSNYTKEKFKAWLSELHDSIGDLNSLWGTSFECFDDVTIAIPIAPSRQGTAMWYDWMVFNNYRVTDYFQFLKNEIRKYDPDALVQIKLMPWLFTGDKKDHGIDFESLIRLCDITGCDASAKKSDISGKHEDWMERYSFQWVNISMTFDFFRSVKPNQIIFDAETHILSSVHFRDLYLSPDYARAAYWLAHMHGLNASRNWVWGRSLTGEINSKVGEGYAGSNNQQPAILNELHATLIDLNTFSEEITAIQLQRKSLRIYYSLTNAINRKNYMTDVFETYQSLYFEGLPLGFATDGILIKEDASNWDAVLIRKTESVTLQEYNTIQSYLNKGGTVIMDGLSLKVNEYGIAHEGLNPGKGTLIIAGSIIEMRDKALDLIAKNGLMPEVRITEKNNNGNRNCVWRCIKNKDGNNVVSIVNLGRNEAEIKIILNDAVNGTICRDLIHGIRVNSNPTLKPDEVYFVEVTENNIK